MPKLPADIVGEIRYSIAPLSGHVFQVVRQDDLAEMLEIAVLFGESFLVVPGMRWAVLFVVLEVTVPASDAIAEVDSAFAEMPSIVGPQRVVAAAAVVVERGIDAVALLRAVPVPKIVVAVLWADE